MKPCARSVNFWMSMISFLQARATPPALSTGRLSCSLMWSCRAAAQGVDGSQFSMRLPDVWVQLRRVRRLDVGQPCARVVGNPERTHPQPVASVASQQIRHSCRCNSVAVTLHGVTPHRRGSARRPAPSSRPP